jgi:hypothetical protein
MTYEFMIPEQYRALIAAGKLVRRGALIIDPNARRIVGHLQETAQLAQTVSGMANPVSAAMKVAELGMGAINTFQLEQVKKRLATMQEMLGVIEGLQVATLATSVVGIGVSAASAAIVCQRINLLRDDVTKLGKEVAEFRDEWRTTQLQELLDKAMTRVERLGSIRNRNNQHSVLQEAETVLHDVFTASLSRGKALLKMENIPVDALQIIVDGLMISGANRVKALLLLDEADEAKNVAAHQVKVFGELTVAMPSDALASKLGATKNPLDVAKQVSAIFSEARLQSASVPHLAEHLSSVGMKPSAFLKIADEEAESPLLFLLTSPRST